MCKNDHLLLSRDECGSWKPGCLCQSIVMRASETRHMHNDLYTGPHSGKYEITSSRACVLGLARLPSDKGNLGSVARSGGIHAAADAKGQR